MDEKKIKRVIEHCQNMHALCDVMDIELHHDIVGTRFTDPRVNNHVRRIKESLSQIKVILSYNVKPLDRDQSTYDHATQMHRVFKFFAMMDTRQMEEWIDKHEQLNAI